MSRFAVVDDSVASGHITEFEYCKINRIPTIFLRKRGKGSTWMIGDASLTDINYIKTFEYIERDLHDVLTVAVEWAEKFIRKRADAYSAYYPWRKEEEKG